MGSTSWLSGVPDFCAWRGRELVYNRSREIWGGQRTDVVQAPMAPPPSIYPFIHPSRAHLRFILRATNSQTGPQPGCWAPGFLSLGEGVPDSLLGSFLHGPHSKCVQGSSEEPRDSTAPPSLPALSGALSRGPTRVIPLGAVGGGDLGERGCRRDVTDSGQ